MNNFNEIAEVLVDGERFSHWESVSIETHANDPHFTAELSVAESGTNTISFDKLKLRIGAKAQVFIAGIKVIDGYVMQRQVIYNATSHAVKIVVGHKNFDATQCSAPLKTSQMAGYSFEAIARTVLAPYNIGLSFQNPPEGYDRPFKDVSIQPGETVFEFIERLARQRRMWITSDQNGDYVVGCSDSKGAPLYALVEGVNILSANSTVKDDEMYSTIDAVGQGRGDDNVNGVQSSAPAATTTNPSITRYRNLTLISEEPGTSKDMADRIDSETMMRMANSLTCTITVQGWLDGNQQLWWIRNNYTVNSPMLLIHGVTLVAQKVVFEQSNSSGTTTTIELVRPEALDSSALKKDSSSDDQETALPGGQAIAATPVATNS